MAQPCEAPRGSQVQEAVRRLANEVERASSVQGMVYERLESVLGPDVPADMSGAKDSAGGIAPLALELNQLTDRLSMQTDAYLALTQRLEN